MKFEAKHNTRVVTTLNMKLMTTISVSCTPTTHARPCGTVCALTSWWPVAVSVPSATTVQLDRPSPQPVMGGCTVKRLDCPHPQVRVQNLHSSVLQTVMKCKAVQCSITQSSALHHDAVQCNSEMCNALQWNTLNSSVLYTATPWYCTV